MTHCSWLWLAYWLPEQRIFSAAGSCLLSLGAILSFDRWDASAIPKDPQRHPNSATTTGDTSNLPNTKYDDFGQALGVFHTNPGTGWA